MLPFQNTSFTCRTSFTNRKFLTTGGEVNQWTRLSKTLVCRPIGEEEVLPLVEKISPGGSTVGGKLERSSAFLSSYIPKAAARETREDSPDLLELEAQINALK